MQLFFYNKELELLDVVEGFTSLRWVRRYSKVGEFELHMLYNEKTKKLFKSDVIVGRKDVPEAAIIESVKFEDKATETAVVKGRFISSLFDRRIIQGTMNFNSTAEDAMRTAIQQNAIAPTNNARIIERVALATRKGLPIRIAAQVSDRSLLQTIENFANASALGFRTYIDEAQKKLFFEVYEGVDRSALQTAVPKIIFSDEKKNLQEAEFSEENRHYKNVSTIAGEGEGADRTRVTIGTAQGWERRESFVDARDLNSDGLTPTEYADLLRERGRQKQESMTKIEMFEGKLSNTALQEYKTGYDLGDIVTIEHKQWGKIKHERITEISEVYENGKAIFTPTFGSPLPTIIDLLKEG